MTLFRKFFYLIYYPGGCVEEQVDHTCNECGDIEHARVRSAAYIAKEFVFDDPTNPVEWQDGIAAKQIIIIPEVTGTFNGGEALTGPGYGDQDERMTGYRMEVNFRDPNYGDNGDFYDAIKRSRRWRLAFRTENFTHISDKVVSVRPNNPITEPTTDEVTWNVTNTWTQADLAKPIPTPPGIFDRCFAYES